MKQQIFKIQSVVLILALAFSLNSCSYTKNTGTSSNFNKKHYNKGIVKHKSSKKDKTEILAENHEELKLSKKEQKEALKIQVQQYVDAKHLTASNEEVSVEQSTESLVEKVQGNFNQAKSNLLEAKESASAKEIKKIDKRIRKIEKFENMLTKVSAKMEARLTPDPDAIAPPQGKSLIGLLAGIFGIAGLVLSAVPYAWFLGVLLCISAIVLGVIGLDSDKRGWAIAGIVLGSIGVLFFFLFAILIAILLL